MSASMVAVVVVLSQVALFAARDSIHEGLRAVARSIVGTCRLFARWCSSTARELQERNTEVLLEVGRIQIEQKIERELRRLDGTLTKDLTQHTSFSRDLAELTGRLQADYAECAHLPPETGSWDEAAKAAENICDMEHKGAKRMLSDIQRAAGKAEKAAHKEYREATAKRHKILSKIAPVWKRVSGLLDDSGKVITQLLESLKKIESHMDHFEKVRQKSDVTARILMRSARNVFVVSSLVMLVALAGAFINFQLIALPMSELVPAGTRISGIPVSTVAALVLVLMEITVGFFLMDMLGVTNLFPRLEALPTKTKRTILAVAVLALFVLASVEASLAVLREQIVGADNALRQALAGSGAEAVVADSVASSIPVIGQAVLGFVLPWILALVAIPLETLIETTGTAVVSVVAPLLQAIGIAMRLIGYAAHSVIRLVQAIYDVYIAIPISLARLVKTGIRAGAAGGSGGRVRRSAAEAEAHG